MTQTHESKGKANLLLNTFLLLLPSMVFIIVVYLLRVIDDGFVRGWQFGLTIVSGIAIVSAIVTKSRRNRTAAISLIVGCLLSLVMLGGLIIYAFVEYHKLPTAL